MEKSASQARIFDSNEKSILSKSTIKSGMAGWHGVPAHSTHIRTCDLEVPRGHGTVKCGTPAIRALHLYRRLTQKGKYFEVRYFLNVTVGSSHTYGDSFARSPFALTPLSKLVTVQLPIVLIHMVRLFSTPHHNSPDLSHRTLLT